MKYGCLPASVRNQGAAAAERRTEDTVGGHRLGAGIDGVELARVLRPSRHQPPLQGLQHALAVALTGIEYGLAGGDVVARPGIRYRQQGADQPGELGGIGMAYESPAHGDLRCSLSVPERRLGQCRPRQSPAAGRYASPGNRRRQAK